jgi:hypothetical protein
MSYQDMLARYIELRRSGMSGEQAQYEAFGEGGIAGAQESQRRRQAKQQQYAGYGQLAGTAGGMYLAGEGGSQIAKALGFGNDTTRYIEPVAQPELLGGADILSSGQPAQTASTLQTSDKLITPISDTSGVPEGFTKIQVSSNVDGTVGEAVVPTESLQDPGFFDSISVGDLVKGAAGAAQLYSAYKSYKSGDYAGAGIQGVGGATTLASSGLAGTAAQTAATEALGGYLVPGAQIASGLYGAKQTADITGSMAAGKQRDTASAISGGVSGLSLGLGAGTLAGMASGLGAGAAAGAAAGSVVPVVGTIIGAAIGVIASRFMGSGKGKEQVRRDGIRGALQERGVLDENWQGTLADGTKTDFGADGSTLKKSSMDKMREANPASYEPTVQLSDALVAAYGFLGDNNRSVGRMYMRGALSNADDNPEIAAANMRHFAQQQGITFDLIKENIDKGLAEGRIEQPEYQRLLTAATQLVPMEEVAPEPVREVRPEAGQVNRLSAGMYRDANGNLVRADSTRAALERAYKKTKSRTRKGKK